MRPQRAEPGDLGAALALPEGHQAAALRHLTLPGTFLCYAVWRYSALACPAHPGVWRRRPGGRLVAARHGGTCIVQVSGAPRGAGEVALHAKTYAFRDARKRGVPGAGTCLLAAVLGLGRWGAGMAGARGPRLRLSSGWCQKVRNRVLRHCRANPLQIGARVRGRMAGRMGGTPRMLHRGPCKCHCWPSAPRAGAAPPVWGRNRIVAFNKNVRGGVGADMYHPLCVAQGLHTPSVTLCNTPAAGVWAKGPAAALKAKPSLGFSG